MNIFESSNAMQRQMRNWRCAGQTVGFVPTMGALHEGHLSLVRRARRENSQLVVSIFVNPTQFRPGEDFERYPRPFERDCELLEHEKCDAVFAPSEEEMYGAGICTGVEVEGVSTRWEGEIRPGHFRGVATVVTKLFNIVRAHRTYFGEKDFQQIAVIKALTRDLNFETAIVPCPTVRERGGLAMSSRNAYLSEEERQAGSAIYRALRAAQELAKSGERHGETLQDAMQAILSVEKLLQVEYAAIVDAQTLEPLAQLNGKPARAIIAARAGSTRLIDNIAIEGG